MLQPFLNPNILEAGCDEAGEAGAAERVRLAHHLRSGEIARQLDGPIKPVHSSVMSDEE